MHMRILHHAQQRCALYKRCMALITHPYVWRLRERSCDDPPSTWALSHSHSAIISVQAIRHHIKTDEYINMRSSSSLASVSYTCTFDASCQGLVPGVPNDHMPSTLIFAVVIIQNSPAASD